LDSEGGELTNERKLATTPGGKCLTSESVVPYGLDTALLNKNPGYDT